MEYENILGGTQSLTSKKGVNSVCSYKLQISATEHGKKSICK
jgi:hypothetical protein